MITTHLGYASTLLEAQCIRLVDKHMRADCDILGICSAISKAEYCVTFLEATLALLGDLFDDTTKLNTESLGSLRRYWIVTFSLDEVHAIEAKCLDFHQCLSMIYGRPGDLSKVEILYRSLAILNTCRPMSAIPSSDNAALIIPMARMFTILALWL